jgi:DNA-directed RNA polymerase specialized sigma24 family protein
MSGKSRLTLTRIYTAKIDEAHASGDNEKILTALYPLARHISKHNDEATQFLMLHISSRLDRYQRLRYQGHKEAEFSSWAFRVFRYRFIDWVREQNTQRKRDSVLVKPFYREGGNTNDNPDDETLTAEDKLAWWFYEGSTRPPEKKKFGKRELQRLRANKALQMRREGASNVEIAALLSIGKKKAVKPSSVPASLSRWRRKEIVLDILSVH